MKKISSKNQKNCMMCNVNKIKSPYRKIDLMSKRKYTIIKAAGQHLNFNHRLNIEKSWNGYINSLSPISIKKFASIMGMSFETCRRELKRGFIGEIVVYKGKRIYPNYSAQKAQDNIDEGNMEKGARMKLKIHIAERFKRLIINEKRSPYDARMIIIEEHPEEKIPCLRTFYNHIDYGDMGVQRGDTPYHPGRKKRAKKPLQYAKVLPNRRRISERPIEANNPQEKGHLEIDTVVSCKEGKGGLLTIVDKLTKEFIAENLDAISQECVTRAIKRMIHRGALNVQSIKTVTTDNGCEFSHFEELEKLFKAKLYYTHAYASYEKGAIENANRLVRRWYKKGTDFSKVPRKDILSLEKIINSIHRKSLNGMTSKDYCRKIAS